MSPIRSPSADSQAPGQASSAASPLDPAACATLLESGPTWPGQSYRCAHPRLYLQVAWHDLKSSRAELLHLLERLESELEGDGSLGVLALAYEAGWLLLGRTPPRQPEPGRVIADLAVYERRGPHPASGPDKRELTLPRDVEPLRLSDSIPALDFPAYSRAVEDSRQYIAAGDIYQVNLVNVMRSRSSGNPLSLYRAARSTGGAPYLAWLNRPGFSLVSLSPERFLSREGSTLRAAPIKGTARRSNNPDEDRRIAEALEADPKNRAENVMIADLFRNDLGRVAQTGSVRVPALAKRQSFPTVHHLVSEVEAELRPGVGLAEILAATFPSGSITGAPKLRAMELISELEPTDRGFPMGALGVFRSNTSWEMSVLIRTLEVRGDEATFPVGGAITWDSTPGGEWEECLTKRAAFEAALAAQDPEVLDAAIQPQSTIRTDVRAPGSPPSPDATDATAFEPHKESHR